ncbi:MAG: tetratricopeptide repeat protein, partial [Myxococcota bacterium]
MLKRTEYLVLGVFLSGLLSLGCDTQLKRARSAVDNKDFQLAAQLYEKVLDTQPNHIEALMEVTKLYCERMKNTFNCAAKVAKLYEKKKNPTIKRWYKESVLGRAKSLYMQKQLKASAEKLQEYIKMVPDDGVAYF